MKKVKKLIKIINEEPQKYIDTIKTEKDVDILEKLLEFLSEDYYNGKKDVSLVSDEIFDMLKDALEEKRPKSNFLLQVGAPIPKGTKNKVELPYYMGSLDKIKPDKGNLEKWMETYPGPYMWSDKLDGVSALIHNNDGEVKMYTRGDGTIGQDITHLLKYMLPKDFDLDVIPKNYAIRGELIISKKKFEQISDTMKNARNAVAGLSNAKTINMSVLNITKFVGYGIIYPEMKQSEQFKKIKEFGIDVVTNGTLKKMDMDALSDILEKRRDKSIYDIDGIVIIDNSKKHKHVENENPKYGFAFKQVFGNQYTQATVVDVEWRASMDSYLKPRVIISPVELSGVTVTYATAFNAKFVVDNVIGVGSVIQIIRSGDVIPYIMKIIKPSADGKPLMPDVEYEWNSSGTDIVVTDKNPKVLKNVIVKQIVHFFNILKIKNVDAGVIKKFVDNGYDSIVAVLGADPDDLVKINGIGLTLVEKIKQNTVNELSKTDLATFMAASHKFGRGLAVKKLKLLIKKYPNILKDQQKWSYETFIDKIIEIEGFEKVTAEKIVDNFPEFVSFMDDVHSVIDISRLYRITKKPGKSTSKPKKQLDFLVDKKIVFTGFRPKKELEVFIENNGGTISTSVSKNTSLLVYEPNADKQSSKMTDAINKGVQTMTKDEFYKTINWTGP